MAKTLIAKYFLEKTSFSNCDLWSLQNQNFWKQQNLSYLSHKVKTHLTGALENTIFREADVYLKLPQHNFFWKAVVLKLWSLKSTFLKTTESHTAQKMKFSIKDFFSKCDQILNIKLHFLCSVSYLSNKGKKTSLILLKIPFLCKVDAYLKLPQQKIFMKRCLLKLWSLTLPKTAFPKTTETELFEP